MTNFYRIRYCDMDGGEVPVYEAKTYHVFLCGKFLRNFPYLSAANEWIKRQKEAAVLSDGKNTHLTGNAEGREAQNA